MMFADARRHRFSLPYPFHIEALRPTLKWIQSQLYFDRSELIVLHRPNVRF